MLACSTIPHPLQIKYPVYASPKLDGIRCLIIDGVPVSRNLKPIPNKHIQDSLRALNLPKLDGELMLKSGDFNSVQSAIMSESGKPDFEYVVFDSFETEADGYVKRFASIPNIDSPLVKKISNLFIESPKQMEKQYDLWIKQGYEGAIIRDMRGIYKNGRSTLKQGWMLKLKTFQDAEAVIVGREELMHNNNEATTDKLGQTVRSSHKDNQEAGGTLGSLLVEYNGKQFKIGTGFDNAERARLWARGDKLNGKLVTFKFQELSKYGVPRFPVYKGLRHEDDV